MVKLFTTTRTGRPVMDTSYRSRLNAAEVAAGVTTDIDPHCGRNWLITRLAEQGAHVKEIGRLLGQSDLETIIRVYMKVRTGRIDVLMDKVNLSISGE
jgi:putative integrase